LAAPKVKGSNREFETSLRILAQFDNLRSQVCQPSSMLAVKSDKLTLMASKLDQRCTEDLQRAYRDVSCADTRGLDILRRLDEAKQQNSCILIFVMALRDKEATAATLLQAMDDMRTSGLELPLMASQVHHARLCSELAASHQWDKYELELQPAKLKVIFDNDEVATRDFQAGSKIYCTVF
jgi:DNA-binding response OmpR family regulator